MNIGPILPFDKIVGIVNEGSIESDGFGVHVIFRFTVAIGKRFLDLQMLDIEGIVGRIIRRSKSLKKLD